MLLENAKVFVDSFSYVSWNKSAGKVSLFNFIPGEQLEVTLSARTSWRRLPLIDNMLLENDAVCVV